MFEILVLKPERVEVQFGFLGREKRGLRAGISFVVVCECRCVVAIVQVVVMNATLSSAVGSVGVAPRQLVALKSECKSSVHAARAVPSTKRSLASPSISASFSPAPARVEGTPHMRNAVANHDLHTPVVKLSAYSLEHSVPDFDSLLGRLSILDCNRSVLDTKPPCSSSSGC